MARAVSNQEARVTKVESERTRKYSEADAHSRVPPPNVPPPVN